MILSEAEKKILSFTEFQADVPISKLAQNLKMRTHTLYYALNKLEVEGIIKKVPFINMSKLGYSDYYVFFSLSSHESKQRDVLIAFFKNHYLVTWFVELGGEYQYIAALYVKSTIEFSNFLIELSTKFGGLFFKKAFSLHIRFARFNRTYLFPETKRQIISTQVTENTVKIDEFDDKIFTCITEYPQKSKQEIARLLNIPFSTLHYRLQILKKQKILEREVYFIDTTKLGIQAFELLVYTKGLDATFSDQLFEFAKKNINVVHFLQSIGAWDFQLGVEVETMHDATKIVEELHDKFGNIITNIMIIPLFKQLKFKFYRGDRINK